MMAALRAAGFPAVEAEGGVIYGRLSASGAEFQARADAGEWRLSLCWPVRATAVQRAGFAAVYPGVVVDLWQGETRLSMAVGDLMVWAVVAEAFVVASVGWRRAQRSGDEGM